MIITVVGQGYVGLPLSIAASNAGFFVHGFDNNEEKIQSLKSGKSRIEDITDFELEQSIKLKKYTPTSNEQVISKSEIVLVCVPTPLSSNHEPDLSALISATTSIGKNLKPNTLVIIESTIEPGTCRNLILPILIRESGLNPDLIELAYSPERVDPTNKKWNIENTPKIVAGLTESAANKAKEFYEKFVDTLITCSSLEIAETAKLLENSFRLINISFVNELAIFCNKIGIEVTEVIAAASTKPYGFMSFYPSLGAGGHCIPVDPIYLANAAKTAGATIRLVAVADEINQAMPGYFIRRAEQELGVLSDKRILVIGVAYKPNIADFRESPVDSLISGLKQKGAEVFWHDDLVNEWNGEKSVALSSDFDLAIMATPHDYLDLTNLGNVPILNTRGSI
jgi:UDP-N-acetyl-D-glucosamine dehydrogenase